MNHITRESGSDGLGGREVLGDRGGSISDRSGRRNVPGTTPDAQALFYHGKEILDDSEHLV